MSEKKSESIFGKKCQSISKSTLEHSQNFEKFELLFTKKIESDWLCAEFVPTSWAACYKTWAELKIEVAIAITKKMKSI